MLSARRRFVITFQGLTFLFYFEGSKTCLADSFHDRFSKKTLFQKWAAQLNFRSETRCYLHLWKLFREREQILINVLKKHKNKRQASSLSADESGTWFFFSSICTVWRLWPCSCDNASGILSSIHSWGRTGHKDQSEDGGDDGDCSRTWKKERKTESKIEKEKKNRGTIPPTVFHLLQNVPKHLRGVKILL